MNMNTCKTGLLIFFILINLFVPVNILQAGSLDLDSLNNSFANLAEQAAQSVVSLKIPFHI